MELRRIDALPPYVLASIRELTLELRRGGADVVDLGFGNPDLPSPEVAVAKLQEAAGKPHNHRYSASRGIPKLRLACAELYRRRFGVELDPGSQVVATVGAKEGFVHLMWVLLEPGDAALVPSPSYPIHIHGPILAGASIFRVPMGRDEDLFENLQQAWELAEPRPRVIVLSFPHNPTTATVELDFMERVVSFAREHEVVVVHDFAYADLAFDGYEPPSILQVRGADEVAVELYTLSKSFSMAGWRVGFLVGNERIVGGLGRLKSWLDYGTFQPIQIAAITALNEAPETPLEVAEVYRSRRDALCDGLARAGWEIPRPRATMFAWARLPEPYADLGSLEFSELLARRAHVAVSPGVGFGPGGEGHVRFALVENEHRIRQAARSIGRFLSSPGATSAGARRRERGARG
ncbi:MAG: aminotransferase class I/II-fold pyridoxal phosphate-dependent enzyme [Thermoleophilia bacterium]|nr:aminotransferase class I/II-fold pyridoxal phosphate-dependent enzyme [Thermoleophilia bacterium]MDH4345008.1 aminotransferase class I/II-fold pyridoxal phosphate-dependent enzyme [Thermoleophilia bacterium]